MSPFAGRKQYLLHMVTSFSYCHIGQTLFTVRTWCCHMWCFLEMTSLKEEVGNRTAALLDSLEANMAMYSDLEYLGEARYGVQMKRVDLRRCTSQSTTPEKLALNLIEFLVSKQECQDLTVYGHGKLKMEMAPNMRRAIKSQIFSLFIERQE